jgi:hypothetical protein
MSRTVIRAGRHPGFLQKEQQHMENRNDVGAELAALKVKITSDSVFEEAISAL